MNEGREKTDQPDNGKQLPTADPAKVASSPPVSQSDPSRLLFMSASPEADSRELAAGKTPREKAYYVFLGILILAAVGLAVWYLDPFGGGKPDRAQIGGDSAQSPLLDARSDKLEAVNLVPLSGESEPLKLRDLKGKVVLLNLWGHWCLPCIRELPGIAALEERYRDNDRVRIVALAVPNPDQPADGGELRQATQAFLDQSQRDFSKLPVYLDPEALTVNAVQDVRPFRGYPTTLLLDADHFVRRVWNGETAESEFDAAIQAALNETE
jgi:thiol-disulfide isomerase/thioredoxin